MTSWRIETDAPACPEIEDWGPGPETPGLVPGALHLWKVLFSPADPSDPSEPSLGALSALERERARAISNERSRANFLQSRAAMRRILARYLDLAPQEIRFGYGPRGKPQLRSGPRDIEFNLSHSGPLCLLAINRGSELGVDAERIRDMRHMDAIARRMLGVECAGHLRSLPETQRAAAFFLAWTRLEAGVKALGGGLFDGASRSPRGLSWASFVPHPGFRASIAVRGDCPPVRRWRTFVLDPMDPIQPPCGQTP